MTCVVVCLCLETMRGDFHPHRWCFPTPGACTHMCMYVCEGTWPCMLTHTHDGVYSMCRYVVCVRRRVSCCFSMPHQTPHHTTLHRWYYSSPHSTSPHHNSLQYIHYTTLHHIAPYPRHSLGVCVLYANGSNEVFEYWVLSTTPNQTIVQLDGSA